MRFEASDWRSLESLRDLFLAGKVTEGSYWHSARVLELYDRTFAQRIGWKWDAVLAELQRLAWKPPAAVVYEWGCGSGVAARRCAAAFPECRQFHFSDLSHLAETYAAQRLVDAFPGASAQAGEPSDEPHLLLLSHVLGELAPAAEAELEKVIRRASAVVWIEPGTSAISRRLVDWRSRLDLPVLAPCPHLSPCGMQAEQNRRHWCHFFADPPAEVFRDAAWAEFGRRLGIDLRSLPYAYLVFHHPKPGLLPARLIGRARIYKPCAKVLVCEAAGVSEVEVPKREFPAVWKRLKKQQQPGLVSLEISQGRVTRWTDAAERAAHRRSAAADGAAAAPLFD